MVKSRAWLRALAFGVSATVLAACGGTPATTAPGGTGTPVATNPLTLPPAEGAKPGGTITILTDGTKFQDVDPQRIYTGEDLAFFGGTMMRALTAYKFSPDGNEGTTLVPDLATDLGKATDNGKTWSFTLKDGLKWQDGSELTCADVKYGVSRVFANDIIVNGPTYAVQYLDIPGNPVKDDPATKEPEKNSEFLSAYYGPYNKTGQDLYDKAVVCDGKTITFHLNGPHGDFNYTTTLGFSPVPAKADTGETFGTVAPYVPSSGPYMVDSYTTGNGGKMILVRNPNWSKDTDDYRGAYPDRWEVHFGISPKVIDARIMGSSGDDKNAIQYGLIQPENLDTIFSDPQTARPEFEGRAISGFDPYSSYYWVNSTKVPNVKIRQAMAVAIDREAIKLNIGGDFAGIIGDGFIKPNIGQDYAPTGFWDTYFGQKIPDAGDLELAKKLIADSGEPAPSLVYNFRNSETAARSAAIVIDSLGKAGFKITPAPLERGDYYGVVFDPKKAGDFGASGWGADWPNASTVIAPLFTLKGGFDLAQLDDPTYNAAVDAAIAELDRAKQAKMWQDLNKTAVENVYGIPTFFGLSQTIAGTGVGNTYRWAAYGSWPYGQMYVK